MLAILIVIAVYACTFVGMNDRLDGGAKGGFFLTFGVVMAIVGLLSWVLG